MPTTRQRNFRLRPAAEALLGRLEKKLGIDQTSVLHLAIQRLAELEFPSKKEIRDKFAVSDRITAIHQANDEYAVDRD